MSRRERQKETEAAHDRGRGGHSPSLFHLVVLYLPATSGLGMGTGLKGCDGSTWPLLTEA